MVPGVRVHGRDSGAVTILVLLFVLLVALPAAAVGLTAAVRTGTRAELQQVADAAALGGAANVPLASTSDLVDLLASGAPLEEPGRQALTKACQQALLAADASALARPQDGFAATGAAQACTTSGDVSRGSSPTMSVAASFPPETDVFRATARCLEFIGDNFAGPVPDDPTRPVFYGAAGVARGLADVLPLLAQRGVDVTVTADVESPLRGVLGAGPSRPQQVTSRAVRRVKNVVVLPIVAVEAPLLGPVRVSLSPTVRGVTDSVPAVLERVEEVLSSSGGTYVPTVPTGVAPLDALTAELLAFRLPRDCTSVVAALRDDYEDVVDPRDNPRTQSEIVNDALTSGENLKVVLLGPDATLLDVVDVCFGGVQATDPGSPVFTLLGQEGRQCVTEARGSLRASLVR